MKKLMKLGVILIVLYLLVLFLPDRSYSQVEKFESGDSIEEIREKIEHNGYNFTVDHNKIYDMSPAMKERFFTRRLAPSRESAALSQNVRLLDKHLLGEPLPDQFDWRDYNGHSYIGPIRDQ